MGLRIEDIGKPKGVKRNIKRKGRGIGSGRGKTSGRGHKGAKSRAGSGYSAAFEGGQMPLVRRVPKRGFTNIFKRQWNIVNVGTLQKSDSIEDGAVVDKAFLLDQRIIRKRALQVKVLGKGKLSKAITVKADLFSVSAKTAIEEAGGKTEIVQVVKKC